MKNLLRPLCIALAAASLFSGCASRPQAPLELNVVALNDFHGNLEASKFNYTDKGQPATLAKAGGIDTIGAALQAWRAEDKDLMFVAAGDLVGATPAISSMWADEPALTALSMLGMDASAAGNHEFDQGRAELLRQQHGGCVSHRTGKACKLVPDFKGASFTYLAANVVDKATGKTLLPAYKIEEAKGVKVAFIGAVTKDTPSVVLASGIAGLSFLDEADSINKAMAEVRAKGATVFVVLIHEGGHTGEAFNEPDCKNLKGPIVGISKRLDPAIKLIISGHTHRGFQCKVDGRTITQAEMGGHVLSRIKLAVDPQSRELRDIAVRNVIMKPGEYPADPRIDAYLKLVKERSEAALARPVARVGAKSIGRKLTGAGEAPLGNLIADAVLDASQGEGVQIAFMNAGGMRKDLDVGDNLTATFGQAQVVLPFSNTIVVMDMTGAQIREVLEQQWIRAHADSHAAMLQASRGFSYAWDASKPNGQRVIPGSMKLNGVAIDEARSYRVAANNFLAEGGDGFPAFAAAANKRDTQIVDLDAFVGYLAKSDKAGKPAGSAEAAGRVERRN
ncbi:bifunctional metallophosphatase/5'-nucleotidase [Massilia cavernae]|uniref:Bifunctional metallophosphatase/5'-nucleotidase n=1 Tax=Massilia cavernae TaxID=2320864 RepID=A0A418XGR7_9BURK|nr:bifunctional metallophosphatase/5'-nucleotidase [Massilia cavernae]RJG11659.1 bifunctional metallophosphatase/5'-nucleotidase [Massilia cavernae]